MFFILRELAQLLEAGDAPEQPGVLADGAHHLLHHLELLQQLLDLLLLAARALGDARRSRLSLMSVRTQALLLASSSRTSPRSSSSSFSSGFSCSGISPKSGSFSNRSLSGPIFWTMRICSRKSFMVKLP